MHGNCIENVQGIDYPTRTISCVCPSVFASVCMSVCVCRLLSLSPSLSLSLARLLALSISVARNNQKSNIEFQHSCHMPMSHHCGSILKEAVRESCCKVFAYVCLFAYTGNCNIYMSGSLQALLSNTLIPVLIIHSLPSSV